MRSFVLIASAVAVLVLAPTVRAHDHDDDDDHGHGNGRGHAYGHDRDHDHGPKGREEFWDGNCRVVREWKHDQYEEKRTCRAPERVVVVPARPAPPPQVVYVYPPWIVKQQNEYAYAPQYRPQAVAAGVVHCNSETVGQVLGGVVGGTLGHQIGQGSGRTAATIGGAIAGVIVGGDIGRRMDNSNQACVGQVLEVAPVNHRVQWVEGPSTYIVTPAKPVMRSGTYCRPYVLETRGPYGTQRTNGTACRRGDGVWVAA
jgi:surface antigen